MAAGALGRLLEMFEGPEAPGPWSPPAMPAALHALLPWRAFDEASELYVNAGSVGFMLELPPFAGIDAETLGALSGTLADAAPERCTIQIVHWASPCFGAASRAWAEPRGDAGGALARMGSRRRDLLAPGGWRRLHDGGPPFTLSDYRVFVTACLAGGPGPAAETALGAFRRALEGTLASAGATARRLEPDGLLSLAAELTAPDIAGYRDGGTERPMRRWAPRDPLHEQCIAPGRALTVAPTGLTFHHGGTPRSADGGRDGGSGDIAVRVLSAIAFPEVWPGWRGNALIGDFHRDFLQPGCPVLTCLTVVTGDEAAGEKAFLKSARATQQAGTGIARYLPGLPEKARDWQTVTERLKDGERLVRACYMAAVYAPLDSLDEAEQAVRAIYHGQGWRVNAERYMQLPSWLACLPMASAGGLDADLERMGRMKTLLTASAVNLAPIHGEWRGQPMNPDNPPALFLIGRRGQPACWSPFANEAGNYNVAVTGKSGSGKSVLMQELVTGLIGAGGEAVVIDDGRSFQHTAEALGGAFIAFGKDPACLNPFAMIDAGTANHDGDYREECFAMLAGVIGRMARRRGGIDDIEAALIAEAIAAAWDEAGNDADLGTVRGPSGEARRPPRCRHGDRARPLVPRRGHGAAVRGLERPRPGERADRVRARRAQGPRRRAGGGSDAGGLPRHPAHVSRPPHAGEGDRHRRGLGPALRRGQQVLPGRRRETGEEVPRRAHYRHPERQRLLRQPGGARGLGELGLGDLPRPEGRVGRAAEIREAHPLRSRHGAGLEEPDHRGRPLCRAGAARPGRLARRPPRARSVVGGAVLLARPRLRGGRDAQGRGALHRRGHRPARGRRPRCYRTFRTIRNGGSRMTRKATAERPLTWPDDPETVTAADIDFEALAHVLANTCRRGGCCRQYHSVAAHAAIVSEEIEALDGLGDEDRRQLALHALLAPAPSAWLRGRLPDSQRAAERAGRLATGIETAVREAAGLDAVLDEEHGELLRFVTRMAASAERRDIMDGNAAASAGVAFPPLKRRIRSIMPDKAAEAWLARFRALSGDRAPGVGDAPAEDRADAPAS